MSLKSLWKKAKKEVSSVAKKAAGGVSAAAKAATKETYGALKAAAGRSSRVVRDTVEGIYKQNKNLVLTVGHICVGVKDEFRKGFFKGLLDLGKTPFEILQAAGESGLATLGIVFADFVELWGGRPLTAAEKAEARKVFGRSVPLGEVRIATGVPVKAIEAVNGKRPFTTLRLVCYASESEVKKRGMRGLIHELTHVWQFEKDGPIYMVQALEAQARKGQGAYEVTDEMLARNGGNLGKFNREQQATIVERYWDSKWGPSPDPARASRYEPYAKKVYAA